MFNNFALYIYRPALIVFAFAAAFCYAQDVVVAPVPIVSDIVRTNDTAVTANTNVDTIQNDLPKAVDTAVTANTNVDAPQNNQPKAVPRPRTKEELGALSAEELYRLAFGGAAPERPRQFLVRLFVEGRAMGNADILYEPDYSSFAFTSERLSLYFDTLLLPEARLAVGDSMGAFYSALLVEEGYELSINEQMFELHITVPGLAKRLQRKNLGGGYSRVPRGQRLEPAYVSLYANYRIDERYTYRVRDYSSLYVDHLKYPPREEIEYRAPVTFVTDGALTSFGWTLEGSGAVTEPYEGADFTWDNVSRGEIWLSRDIYSLNSRVYLGEVNLSTDMMGGDAIFGARYEQNGWLFGDDPRDDRNAVTFFMPRAGTVELYVNDQYTDRFFLPAGHHQISGFGGNVGHNRVRLVLRMVDGSVEEIPHEFIQSDPRNLPKGDMYYSMAAGVRRDYAPAPEFYRYDFEDPGMSAYIMYGLFHNMSVGVSGMGSRHNGVAGTHFLLSMGEWAMSNLHLYGNYSGSSERFGGRADLSVTPNIMRLITAISRMTTGFGIDMPRMSVTARGYYQHRRFNQSVFARETGNRGADIAGVSGNFGVGLFYGMLSVTGGATFVDDTLKNDFEYKLTGYDYGLRVSQSIYRASFHVSAGENVKVLEDRKRKRTPYFSAGCNYGLGAKIKRHRFSASASLGTNYVDIPARTIRVNPTEEQRNDPNYDGMPIYEEIPADYRYDWRLGARAGWQYATGGAMGQSYSANVSVPDVLTGFDPAFSAGLRHNYNRGQLSLNYGLTSMSSDAYDALTHQASATFAGSLMFADGAFALGRPVWGQGGFILAEKGYGMEGAKLHVDRSRVRNQDFSRSGWLGAAYKNNIDAYQPTEMTLTITNAPVGASLASNQFHSAGGYKQGYKLRVGHKSNVMLIVRLTRGGNPLSHVYATVEEDVIIGEAPRQVTFTGGDGDLQAAGLRRGGVYRIKFGQGAHIRDVIIEIPADAEMIYEADDIEVEVDMGETEAGAEELWGKDGTDDDYYEETLAE